jgi:hypothetical protein
MTSGIFHGPLVPAATSFGTNYCETRYSVFGIRVKNENRTLALMAVLFVVTS